MKNLLKIRRLFTLSPTVALSKICEIILRPIKYSGKKKHDNTRTTYIKLPEQISKPLFTYFKLPNQGKLKEHSSSIRFLVENILNHKFNLLGSGWLLNSHRPELIRIVNSKVKKIDKFSDKPDWFGSHINIANIEEARNIYHNLTNDYNAIDWQIDFKSGYRWKESGWYKDIKFGDIQGVDIKMPWEQGRMQHLPILAYASILSKNKEPDFVDSVTYIYEFRNEILDFIASNPPNFGVQWGNSMEASIRAVNWLVTYDIFSQIPVIFDDEFRDVFYASIYQHARFIIKNLEWSSGMRGNHYLAGIAGLLFISAYLPVTEETSSWLAFAIQELCNEVLYQFLPDGGNFEASTNYHYFSTEILFYSLYVILSLPEEKTQSLIDYQNCKWNGKKKLYSLNKQKYKIQNSRIVFNYEILNRISAIADFSISILKPNYEPPQIGDNDSGKFLKLIPSNYVNENSDSSFLLTNFNSKEDIIQLISLLSCSKENQNSFLDGIVSPINVLPINIKKDGILFKEQKNISSYQKSFPDFGIYIYKKENYHCAVRCGSIGQKGKGGHSHNDQLSFTLNIKGIDIIVDPGTYVYTSSPQLRNVYRSTLMHNTLSIDGIEQNPFSGDSTEDLFWIDKEKTKSKVINYDHNTFSGIHSGFSKPLNREIIFSDKLIKGIDKCYIEGKKKISFHLAPNFKNIEINKNNIITFGFETIRIEMQADTGTFEIEDYNYSPAYGIIKKSKVIRIISEQYQINWQIIIKDI